MYLCEKHSAAFHGDCPLCEHPEMKRLLLQVEELQKRLDLAYPVVEAARTVYEIQEKAQSRGKSVGAVMAYEETREDHLAACEAMNKAVKTFNAKAVEMRNPAGDAIKALQDEAVDVANFCMMLWDVLEEERQRVSIH